VPPELLIPLAILLVLLGMLALLLRRVWNLVLESRQVGDFRRAVQDLAARIDEALDGIIVQIDRVRRHQVEAASIMTALDRTLELLPKLGDEARALEGPPVTAAARLAFVTELDRAERAPQMVEHGCAILATAGSSYRQIEAETAIKRGYLNVVHAREALSRHAEDIAAGRPQDELRWLSGRKTPEAPE
jgi:hypothetical protein